MQQYSLRANRLEISFAENGLGVLMVNKPDVSQAMCPFSKEGQACIGLCDQEHGQQVR